MQTQIPQTLKPFFQEYTFENLDAELHAELVIERALAWGNRAELRWLFERYGRERVTEWVKRKGTRLLPRRQMASWKVILEIPESEIVQTRRGIWPY